MQVYSKILLQTCFVDIVGICIIQIHVYRHCKGVQMTQLRNMNKQLSIVLGAQ
uniref:Uncharacterized protein n=1 Tax=Meloidogyne javanica TaxID=6303 RepID=A0A915LYZ4_MELJA